MLNQINIQTQLQNTAPSDEISPINQELNKIIKELEKNPDIEKGEIIKLLKEKDNLLGKEVDDGPSQERIYQICLLRSAIGMAINKLEEDNKIDKYEDKIPQKPIIMPTIDSQGLHSFDVIIVPEPLLNQSQEQDGKKTNQYIDQVKEVFSQKYNCFSSIEINKNNTFNLCYNENKVKERFI
ncbi:MAG: hypothetical protein SFT90_07055 [Rickettsiales bacterium]|nr:hypothetical protein [Rickettsiales bacterium]